MGMVHLSAMAMQRLEMLTGERENLLKKFENNTQFIIVTHNKKTMASCQALYGVTMKEKGVSRLIPVLL
jgi:chromosome segregation protein